MGSSGGKSLTDVQKVAVPAATARRNLVHADEHVAANVVLNNRMLITTIRDVAAARVAVRLQLRCGVVYRRCAHGRVGKSLPLRM